VGSAKGSEIFVEYQWCMRVESFVKGSRRGLWKGWWSAWVLVVVHSRVAKTV